MITSIDELEHYFKDHNHSTYERENYDKFLSHMNFSFPIKSIHITGTNGKGSTANYIYNIYLAKGLKVGLFNSPYLSKVNEMILVNGKYIDDEEYLSLFNEYHKEFEEYHLSSFEMQTYIAFQCFIKHNLDLVVVEVGMGGFIDATNVITPLISVITNVSLEHTAYLGRSTSEIAYNKAGIIKEDSKAVIGKIDETALYAINEYAKIVNSEIIKVNDFHNERVEGNNVIFDYYPLKDLKLNTRALYQCKNASIAIEVTNQLKDVIDIDEESIRKGLFTVSLPCRLDYVRDNLILDGAHNPDGINNLVESLQKSETRPIHAVFATFKDKNIETMLISLSNFVNDVTLTTFDHPRARNEEDYFLYLGDYSFNENYLNLINEKLTQYPDDVVLVTGSLAFAGKVKEVLK